MTKIVITIEDDKKTGNVSFKSECNQIILENGLPSPAMQVAIFLLDKLKENYGDSVNMKN